MTKPQVIIHKPPNKNGSSPNSNVVNGIEISTYDQAYDCHGELPLKLSMVSNW